MIRQVLKQPATILLVLALIFTLTFGFMSLDVGRHWDEGNIQWSVQKSAETGLLLPNWYLYPSLPYDVALLVAGPSVAKEVASNPAEFKSTGEAAISRGAIARSKPYLLRLRAVFFTLSMLAGVAVFLLVLALTRNSWTALFSALLLMFSPEFFYHARWVATDTLLAMLTGWALLIQYWLFTARPARQFVPRALLAGAFVGLCMGTKYPGGILFVPLALAVWLPERGPEIDRRLKFEAFAGSVLAAIVVFLLTTPGAMVDPLRFVRDVLTEVQHYGTGHGGYTVTGGLQHFTRLGAYMLTEVFSEFTPFAFFGIILGLAGAVYAVRERGRLGIWLVSLPVIFLAYMTQQRVMIVRNDMLLLPVIAVLAGLGVEWVFSASADRRWLKVAAGVLLVSLIGLNAYHLADSSMKTRLGNPVEKATALRDRLQEPSAGRYLLSPGARTVLSSAGITPPAGSVESTTNAERFVFLSDEVAEADWRIWPANVRGRYVTVWARGDEINWDYYPTWYGSYRVLEVSTGDKEARKLIDYIMSDE